MNMDNDSMQDRGLLTEPRQKIYNKDATMTNDASPMSEYTDSDKILKFEIIVFWSGSRKSSRRPI